MTILKITELEAGERIDKMLASIYPEYSRSAIEKLVAKKQILINDAPVKTKYSLKEGDKVSIDFSELDKEPEEIDIPVIFEDDNVVVINKPIGILAHTKGVFSKEGTAATFLQAKLNGSAVWKSSNRAGIVHRLDRATSGVMIMAKNKETEDYLKGQFSKRNVKKSYIAVISGTLPEESGLIDVPIERNPKKPATFRAGINGKAAQTGFNILKTNQKYSMVELRPVTGRTHQLRVHLNYLKRPIVGDEFYSGEKAGRLMLHARMLEITLPGGDRKVFETPLPKEFDELLS